MLCPNQESSDGVPLRTCTVLLLHLVFLLEASAGAQSELICSHQPIVALAGEDVILPCHLDPAVSASSETVVWTRPGLEPKYVHVYRDGGRASEPQNPSYHFRTALFADEMMSGNVFLKLSGVKISDAGKYFCFLPSMHKEASIQLTVGAVSEPIIEVVSDQSNRVVLQCKSEGWYPEPEVFWLDGEENPLPAGPTETVRGPDELYTVSSRVAVDKRQSNSFTCRVQQKNINRTRQTNIYFPADIFTTQSCSAFWCYVALAVIVTLVLVCIIWIKSNRETAEMFANVIKKYQTKIKTDVFESAGRRRLDVDRNTQCSDETP